MKLSVAGKRTMPEVGEVFTSKNWAELYIRIDDVDGRRTLDYGGPYCVCLKNGKVYNFFVSEYMIVLKPVNGGKIFEEK